MNQIINMAITGVLIILAVISYTKYRYISNNSDKKQLSNALIKIKSFILDYIEEAERKYTESKKGLAKKSFVIGMILNCEFYKNLPQLVQKMITYEILSKIIDDFVENVFKVAKNSSVKATEELQKRLVE